jgi:RNA polymerase sigma-70 factor (ECF subfamily)
MKNFNQLYAENYNKTVIYVNFRIRDLQKSEEITNDAFMKIYKHFDEFDQSKGKFTTWLYQIVKNTMIDYIRADYEKKYTVKVSGYVNDDGEETFQYTSDEATDEGLENAELSTKIEKAFNKLKPAYRNIAELYFIKQMKYDEIVTATGLPMGSVKGMISRCRELLQNNLVTA